MKISSMGLFVVATVLGGCALTSKADPMEIRWFSPADQEASGAASRAAAGTQLRLGRVTASDHLRQRIVVRTSPVELDSYEDRRWTEKPEDLVKRSLMRALFERGGMVHAVAGAGTTLDVEVLAFEEVRHDEQRRSAAVALHFTLHDERVVLGAETIRVEIPIEAPNDSPTRLAEAVGVALEQATGKLATRVAEGLAAQPQPEPAPLAEPPPAASAVRR